MQATFLHVQNQVLRTVYITLRTVAFEKRVVCDNVELVDLAHLCHELARTGQIPGTHADVEDAVVGSNVGLHARLLQRLQHLESSFDVLVVASCSDQRHIVLNVQCGSLAGEFAGQVCTPALHSELHQTTIHHGIGLQALCDDLLVEITSFVIHAGICVDLHQGAVDCKSHAMMLPDKLCDVVRKAQELGLRAAGQQANAQRLTDANVLLLHLLK
mmetsp:Transcript_52529/g.96797  ORF Transcript_52529/g.96797 Transcript_52529/m.96797 type:complete len:215 (-) Transcript_52529:758-1402(-)